MSKILLLGSGHKTQPEFNLADLFPDAGFSKNYESVTRLDINPDCEPDILADASELHHAGLPREYYDEIHAYEVMEHFGAQGDYRAFFDTMNDIAELLRPGGHFITSSPNHDSPWAWGDPGHTRVILPETYCFLYKSTYEVEDSPATDYRRFVRYWWEPVGRATIREGHSYLLILKRL